MYKRGLNGLEEVVIQVVGITKTGTSLDSFLFW